MNDEPQGAFTCRSSTLAYFVDADPFHGLLLAVLGSQSDLHGCCTQGTLTCRSSTIIVLADSGPFLRLLLSDLGSQTDFHDLQTPGYVYVSFINNPRFVRFRALSWTSTHRFKVPD